MTLRVLARESRNGDAISKGGDPVKRSRFGEREEWGNNRLVLFILCLFKSLVRHRGGIVWMVEIKEETSGASLGPEAYMAKSSVEESLLELWTK